jgi:hypothetical protein
MHQLYLIPNWFFGYDVCLEILFGIVAAFVASYSLKLYKMTKQREIGLFGTSFVLISLSYFTWSLINLFFVKELNETTRVLIIDKINILNIIGIYSHILLFMAGLITLFYITCKTNDYKLYSALLIISTLTILLALDKPLAIYTLSTIILLFITSFYFKSYRQNKNKKTFAIALSFTLLTLANIFMAISNNNYTTYVITHIAELASFIIILGTMIKTLKHGKKKK